jgi:hypothetical protein
MYPPGLMNEIGRTVRAALRSWPGTIRLSFLITVAAVIGTSCYICYKMLRS